MGTISIDARRMFDESIESLRVAAAGGDFDVEGLCAVGQPLAYLLKADASFRTILIGGPEIFDQDVLVDRLRVLHEAALMFCVAISAMVEDEGVTNGERHA